MATLQGTVTATVSLASADVKGAVAGTEVPAALKDFRIAVFSSQQVNTPH
jgi:hypothetical protein